MARVRNGVVTKARHKKVLKEASGYFGSKHRLYKSAKEQLMHSGVYAYRDRRQKKRDFRKLWIVRINAECRVNDISYSRFIEGLNKAGVEINRKMLSEIAINDKEAFKKLVELAKSAKNGKIVKEEKVLDKEEEKATSNDLSKLTLAELKEMAKEQGLEGYSTMKKAELVEVLNK